jgi:uncharacterized membrane protein YoaK (UPF0700 family)
MRAARPGGLAVPVRPGASTVDDVGTEASPSRRLLAGMLLLTFIAGWIDAVSFLGLGRVFVANMTGNVVLLGFALAGAGGLSVSASLTALLGFLAGAVAAGRLAAQLHERRRRWLGTALVAETACVALAAATSAATRAAVGPPLAIVAVLAAAMGLQSGTARRLAVPDLSTTVLTMTLTGLAVDSRLAGGHDERSLRRIAAVVAILAGALAGGLLVLRGGPAAALVVAAGLVAVAPAAVATG